VCVKNSFNFPGLKMFVIFFLHFSFNNMRVTLSLKKSVASYVCSHIAEVRVFQRRVSSDCFNVYNLSDAQMPRSLMMVV
jgi:hypothetical protein